MWIRLERTDDIIEELNGILVELGDHDGLTEYDTEKGHYLPTYDDWLGADTSFFDESVTLIFCEETVKILLAKDADFERYRERFMRGRDYRTRDS